MSKKIFFGLALCILLASFGSCIMATNVDDSNLTETLPMSFRNRMSRTSEFFDRCTTSDGFTGACMSRSNCVSQGGAVSGFCGTYGVCCETNLQCGASSRQKITIIKNPDTLPINSCPYIIEPYSVNVCQLHISFERFTLEQPALVNSMLTCADHLVVNELRICGNNHGQHIYVPFNVASGMDHVQLQFILPNRWNGTTWRLIVTQLECPAVKTKRTVLTVSNSLLPLIGQNSFSGISNIILTHNSDFELLAPPGCLQYYTAPFGSFKSFNYNDFMGPYLSGMTYAICFKRTYQDSMIQFTVQNFGMSKHLPNDDGFDNHCHTVVHTEQRRNDYLMIPQGMLVPMTAIQPTYFCGDSLKPGQIIYSATTGPFVVYFSSDTYTDGTEKGFQFIYRIQ